MLLTLLFALLFIGLWIGVATFLDFFSGWSALARTYPDKPSEKSIVTIVRQMGRMGVGSGTFGVGVYWSGVLRLSACESGFRISVPKIYRPFVGKIFVPWSAMEITRGKMWFLKSAHISFKESSYSLDIPYYDADLLWNAIPSHWPEKGNPPAIKQSQIFASFFRMWAIYTGAAALFFFAASHMAGGGFPPVAVDILFPGIVFGIGFLFIYPRQKHNAT